MLQLQTSIQAIAVFMAGCAAFAVAFSIVAYLPAFLPAFLLAWSMQGLDYAKKELNPSKYARLCLDSAKSALTLGGLVQRKR